MSSSSNINPPQPEPLYRKDWAEKAEQVTSTSRRANVNYGSTSQWARDRTGAVGALVITDTAEESAACFVSVQR